MNSISRNETSPPDQSAFTLTELVVVLCIIALLALMVLPAMAGAAERSRRMMCQNNLRQIAVGATLYAGSYGGKIFSARAVSPGLYVQNVLNPVDAAAAGTVGLTVQSNSAAWSCPNRPGLPIYEPVFPQWVIGYQYFGGITTWQNPVGTFQSRSPTNLAQARPYWTLAADTIFKVNGVWGSLEAGRSLVYSNAPPHHTVDSMIPEGGNQVFVDGSVRWIPFEQMYFLHSWSVSSRLAYFYQDPKDFPAGLGAAALGQLRAIP